MRKYIHYGNNNFEMGKFNEIRNTSRKNWNKPIGGLWACDVNSQLSWLSWCKEEEFTYTDFTKSFCFLLSKSCRLLKVDNIEVLKEKGLFPKNYDYKKPFLDYIFFDFEQIKKSYDAIEVLISRDERLYYTFYGWDCDSILIMNPDVISIINP